MRGTDQSIHVLLQFKKGFDHFCFINLDAFSVLKGREFTEREILCCQPQMTALTAGISGIGFDQTAIGTEDTDQTVRIADIDRPQDKALEPEMRHVTKPQFWSSNPSPRSMPGRLRQSSLTLMKSSR